MNETFKIGVGDTGPPLIQDLVSVAPDGSTTAIDLTGASNLTFHLLDDTGTEVISHAGTIVDAPGGRVSYAWAVAAPSTGGTYYWHWTVTLSDGSNVTIPNDEDGFPLFVSDSSVVAATGRLTCQPWCAPDDVLRCQPCSAAEVDLDAVDEAIQVASDVLYLLSGRQPYGVCADTIRPIHDDVSGWWYPQIGSYSVSTGESWGTGIGSSSGYRARDYVPDRRTFLSELRLPAYPVHAITQVRVDGTVLPSSAYAISDNRWLVRLGGSWPCCQDLTKAPSAVGSFEVQYTYGVPVPPMAVRAAAAYACQVALACGTGSGGECALPPRAQQVVRQGISVRVLDPQDFTEEGRTGVPAADAFLKAVNPYKLQERAAVLTPDMDWPAVRLR